MYVDDVFIIRNPVKDEIDSITIIKIKDAVLAFQIILRDLFHLCSVELWVFLNENILSRLSFQGK